MGERGDAAREYAAKMARELAAREAEARRQRDLAAERARQEKLAREVENERDRGSRDKK